MSEVPTPWITDGELLLHIGVNKTGTSALQGAMALARPQLLEQGVCYPGRDPNHLNVIKSMLQKRRGWENGGRVPPRHLWDAVADELRSPHARRQMISAEYICGLRMPAAQRILDEISADRVKVVVTLRPLEQLLPSQWQQGVKGRWTEPYAQWMEAVCDGPGTVSPSTARFWWRNDHGALIDRWSRLVGADRVLAVVVDTSNRNMIFETFEDLLGVTRGTIVADPGVRTNRSLSAEEAELLRMFNEGLPTDIDYAFHQHVVRRNGIERIVEGRRPSDLEHTLRVPRHVAERMREIGAQHVTRLRELGIPVVGNLDDLVPTTPLDDTPVDAPRTVPVEVAAMMLQGVVAASAALVADRDARLAALRSKRRSDAQRQRAFAGRHARRAHSVVRAAVRRLRR